MENNEENHNRPKKVHRYLPVEPNTTLLLYFRDAVMCCAAFKPPYLERKCSMLSKFCFLLLSIATKRTSFSINTHKNSRTTEKERPPKNKSLHPIKTFLHCEEILE